MKPGTLQQAERRAIRDALRLTFGNLTQAARLLGISREGLRGKMRRHRLTRPNSP